MASPSFSVGAGQLLHPRLRGTITNIESAFQNNKIHEFRATRAKHSAPTSHQPRLTGNAATLVKSVSGLSNLKMRPYIQLQADPLTGKSLSNRSSIKA